MRSQLDHLVVACADLAQGAAWARDRLGAEPQPGGQHAAMGTHNRLLRLGERAYLELIAVDPAAPAPSRPRWFGLDDDAVRARARREPFLLTWVAATSDIFAAVARVPELGDVQAFTRNAFAWRFALRADGALNFDGVLPSLIQWDSAHPAAQLEERGCTLLSLELAHPQAEQLLQAFRTLKLTGPVNLSAAPVSLKARVRTPSGVIDLA